VSQKPVTNVLDFFLLLGGAAVLTVLAAVELPPLSELFRAPETPFDRTMALAAAPEYRLLSESAAVIPLGVSVCAVAEPRNALRETWLHRGAVGLLPGRRIIPAAVWNTPTHDEDRAEFRIVAGPRPALPPGDLVLETPRGSVWRRRGR